LLPFLFHLFKYKLNNGILQTAEKYLNCTKIHFGLHKSLYYLFIIPIIIIHRKNTKVFFSHKKRPINYGYDNS